MVMQTQFSGCCLNIKMDIGQNIGVYICENQQEINCG